MAILPVNAGRLASARTVADSAESTVAELLANDELLDLAGRSAREVGDGVHGLRPLLFAEPDSGEMLADPRYAGWSARRLDIEHDDLPDETFALVLSQLALHPMGDVPGVIVRLAALLTPGGWVALADLEHDADGGFHRHVHGFSGHHGFSREDLGRWLTAAGLVEVTVGDAGFDVKEVEGEERRFPLLLAAGRRPSP